MHSDAINSLMLHFKLFSGMPLNFVAVY